MEKFQKAIKLIVAFLLLLCLFRMPYGYYMFARFVALIGFAILAYYRHKLQRQIEMVIYIALALLFQPFIKLQIGRDFWIFLDILVIIGLIVSIWWKRNLQKINEEDMEDKDSDEQES